MTLPQALQPLAAHRQWITWQSVPDPAGGKPRKVPTDWRTGKAADAHDPAIWTDYATAAAHGPVGFVFTKDDPFWFLDIDGAYQSGAWSPMALELCAQFQGAAVEVSVSGTGLHIIGVGTAPRHKTRNQVHGLEFYTEARFMALGTGAVGNAMTDHTSALAKLVADHFTPGAESEAPAAWTSGPDAAWNGPIDDTDLLRRAMQSKSTAAAFGARASFADLWDANEPVLKGAYPDANRPYDASSADAALAQHLAFWTGKDCDRIVRLMWHSKLARAKWTDHAAYLSMTVSQAVGKQRDVLRDPIAAPVAATVSQAVDHKGGWLMPEDMKTVFTGCCWVMDTNTIQMPDGSSLNEARFNIVCGGVTYCLDRSASKPAKHAWAAFTDSRDVKFPKVHSTSFDPSQPPGAIWKRAGKDYVNAYVPVNVESKKGNAKPFLDHLIKLLPDARDREIILAYMAAVVQHPGVKFQWCPLIQGAEGNGKSLLSRCVGEAVGEPYSHWPVANEIAEKFNGWIENKIFIGVEDIYLPESKSDVIEILKPMITQDRLEIRGMGREKVTRRICANFILNSNHKDAIRKTRNDRRFAIFYTAQQSEADIVKCGMGDGYFIPLYNWLRREGYAIVTDYLKNYAIPDALNPAVGCQRAPKSSSYNEALEASTGRMEQEIQHAIEQEQIGFKGGWISSHYVDQLIEHHKATGQYPRNKRTALLFDLGYYPHPGLTKGQTNNPISPDNCKPRLFIPMVGHPAEHAVGAEVSRLYSDAQTAVAAFLRSA